MSSVSNVEQLVDSLPERVGARFENLVACHLLKYCHWIEDTEGLGIELRYPRDTDRRKVDFVVLRGRRPQFAVECKTGERAVGRRFATAPSARLSRASTRFIAEPGTTYRAR